MKPLAKSFFTPVFWVLGGFLAIGVIPALIMVIATYWGEMITWKHKNEVGNTLVYQVSAEVATQGGVVKQSKVVRAKIVGHKQRGGGVFRVYEAEYENGETFAFLNTDGDRLELEVSKVQFLHDGSDLECARMIYKNGEIELVFSDSGNSKPGTKLILRDLESPDSVEKNGFRIISYKVELVDTEK